MLTGINGTIKIGDDDKAMLEIAQNDLEKFKEYENISNPEKFYVDFSLGNEQLYITGSLKEKKNEDNTVIMPILSAKKQDKGKACTTAAEIKTLLGLDNEKKKLRYRCFHIPKNK